MGSMHNTQNDSSNLDDLSESVSNMEPINQHREGLSLRQLGQRLRRDREKKENDRQRNQLSHGNVVLNLRQEVQRTNAINVNEKTFTTDSHTPSFLTERTIISARNDDVSAINNVALSIFPGEKITYLAADKISDEDELDPTITTRYPTEYVNSLDPTGLPPFKLDLKVGCPVILLRNIAPKDGLCNGTRLIVTRCATRVVECRILTGDKAGNLVFIPRKSLTPSSLDIPFTMSRRQFPLRLAYAVTINKSQGQSVKIVGVDLRTPVFSHGQLYVTLFRCTNFDDITVLLSADGTISSTTNIVYPEVLL